MNAQDERSFSEFKRMYLMLPKWKRIYVGYRVRLIIYKSLFTQKVKNFLGGVK